MSPRAILSLSTLPNVGYVLRIEEEIVPLSNDEDAQAICNFDMLDALMQQFEQPQLAPGTVGTVGSALYNALVHHAPVQRQLTAALQPASALLIDDISPEAQAFPWEALPSNNDSVFWALNENTLLGRTVSWRQQQPQAMVRVWEQKVRVLAVLAATGTIDGRPRTAAAELRALVAGLSAGALPFELRIVGCDFGLDNVPADEDVREVAKELQAGLRAPDQTVEFRELADADAIRKNLTELRPHIVHFFCHGLAANDMAPRIELALRRDQALLSPRGSLVLEAEDLADLLDPSPSVWLVVLNCCLGAAATESISLARHVLSRAGRALPAIVAMREAIDRQDAHIFTTAFYREAVSLIGEAVRSPSTTIDLQWLSALPSVRKAMCRKRCKVVSKAADCREWTVPVMYIRREPLKICKKSESSPSSAGPPPPVPLPAPAAARPAAPSEDSQNRLSELQAQLTTLKTIRTDLAALPAIPPGKIEQLDAHIAQMQLELLDQVLRG